MYDGWNLIREVTTQGGSSSTDSYVWGLDLSGSLQGAGGPSTLFRAGIGGLLLRQADAGTFAYLYDANGNAGQLVNSATGALAAHYEYDPFGNTLVMNGPKADKNPFRFSTKYLDTESGLYYYGYRYYAPEPGRWINRDPIGEGGGLNLYEFGKNDPISKIDILGLWSKDVHFKSTKKWAQELSMPGIGASLIAYWDNKVDDDYSPFRFTETNWSWHFDRSDGGDDTRLAHTHIQLNQAKIWCNWNQYTNDDWRKASQCMGRALHPLQDWVAHGDFNRRSEAPNISSVPSWNLWERYKYAHNKFTEQPGRSYKSVDDPTLDSEGPDGRATFEVLQLARVTKIGDALYWARFRTGSQRINLTEKKTKALLKEFIDYVRINGKPCGGCQKIFTPPSQ